MVNPPEIVWSANLHYRLLEQLPTHLQTSSESADPTKMLYRPYLSHQQNRCRSHPLTESLLCPIYYTVQTQQPDLRIPLFRGIYRPTGGQSVDPTKAICTNPRLASIYNRFFSHTPDSFEFVLVGLLPYWWTDLLCICSASIQEHLKPVLRSNKGLKSNPVHRPVEVICTPRP